jgi:endo-1,4-beta-mannosidase
MLHLMAERRLDALLTVFTGQLSGWYFLPSFNRLSEGFYTDQKMWDAEEVFIRELARVARPHPNMIGFDIGNEINTCWSSSTPAADAWMSRMFALMNEVLPGHLHVNGVDHQPWFRVDTFSPEALASQQRMPVMHCYPYWTGAVKYGGPMDPPSVKLLAAMAVMIRSYAGTQQKPVWAGEFNTCIEELTEKQQAQWLENAVLAAMDEGVTWFSYWDSHDVDRRFAFNPLEYSLGLLTNDGRVKERGRVFKQLADAHRGKSVVLPNREVPRPPVERTTEATWRWLLDWMEWRPKSRRHE